jgi:hypothetical protein
MDSNGDSSRHERQRERELWILLIGAMLVSKPIRTEALANLDANSCPFEELAGMLGGLAAEDADRVWSWAAKLGVEMTDDKLTVSKGALLAVKKRIARRACKTTASLLGASALLEQPEEFATLLEQQAKRIRSTL